MGNIELKQYDGSRILPKDDAILYDMIVGQNGIIKGCELTWLGSNQIHIDSGYGIIKGRLFEISDQTIYAKLPDSSVSHYGYVLITVDLSNTDEPIKITTCVYEYENIEWTQDDEINLNNGQWEMLIGEYRATSTGISTFADVTVEVTAPFSTLKDFSEWAATKEEGYIVDATLSKKQILTYESKTITPEEWEDSSEYEEYPYRVFVSCIGVDSNYVPYVMFNMTDAISGRYAPIATTVVNGVYIYANEKPTTDVTIETIQCVRKVG